MTLVLGIATADSIWLLTDRRLTQDSNPYRDDALKVLALEASDGMALLGYAGLGETRFGTEPSEWMSRVLRGRNLTVEKSLEVLACAASEQLPKHLKESAHVIASVAMVDGEPRVYRILVGPKPDQLLTWRYVYKSGSPPPFISSGTGEVYLRQHLDDSRQRDLLRLVKACSRGQVSPQCVTDYLARLNYEASLLLNTVGANCVAVWRFRKGNARVRFGDGWEGYAGTERAPVQSLPSIVRGMDLRALGEIFGKQLQSLRAQGVRAPEIATKFDPGKAMDEFLKLPKGPDETLD